MNQSIKKARKEIGLMQKQVAIRSQISERYYQAIEAGECIPNAHIAIRIADALNSTVETLFGGGKPTQGYHGNDYPAP